jgi:hypothetical protein
LAAAASCEADGTAVQPPQHETAASLNARVPDAIATAVDWWTTREPSAISRGPVVVSLAPSLTPAHDAVADLLPSCDVTDTDTADAVAIRAVRMHFTSAQVDIDMPHEGRGRQLITVDLEKYLLTPWTVTGANWWRFNDRQLERITADAATSAKEAAEAAASADEQVTADASDEP